jgi:hypothetical protein
MARPSVNRLRIGIVRYAAVAEAIARELTVERVPDCRIGQGRVYITFRSIGASRWSEQRQMEHALKAAAIARAVFASDQRTAVRRRAGRAIVVVYEDASSLRGCSVTAKWECVVPAS